MSTTRGAPQGVVRMIDPPDEIRQEVQDRRHRLRHRGPPRARGEAGHLEPARDHVRRDRRADPELEARYDGGGYGRFKEDVAEAVVALLEPIQERYASSAPTRRELRALLARGAEKAREAAAPTLEQMYERMGFVRP